ncbi:MAG: lamin tail domain-containing protein, partial [Aldersonia sp.]|nr:lamin tail domain-containing protein [Aldersonia sp.]
GDLQPSVSYTTRRWQYQLRFAGDRRYLASRSRVFTVESSMAVTASTGLRTTVSLGNAIPLEGQVDPVVDRTAVQVQRRTSRGWRTVGTAEVRADGTYSTTLRPSRSGKLSYRVRHPGDRLRVAGVSNAFALQVYAARIAAVQPSDAISESQDLNRESIVVRNTGRIPVPISAWSVVSNRADEQQVPAAPWLRAGDVVTIHSGRGRTQPGHIYLGRRIPMWTDSGIATLRDEHGDVAHERRHGPAWSVAP